VSMTKKEAAHKHQFAGAFAVAPSCFSDTVRDGRYLAPLILFLGDQDNANDPTPCLKIKMKKPPQPIHIIKYMGADHGFPLDAPAHDYNGRHLSYSPSADSDMMQTIIRSVKTQKFTNGTESR
jgi:dienelactone hydrolase